MLVFPKRYYTRVYTLLVFVELKQYAFAHIEGELMARLLYTTIYYLLLPLILLRLLWRGRKAPAYRSRIAERFGFFAAPKLQQRPLWVHAVSVGETIAATPMIRRLLADAPSRPIVITCMTPTGSERVQALFAEQLGKQIFHVYVPYDLPGSVKRFLKRLQPCALVIMETELWPNIIHYSHHQGVPVIIANARLSEKSLRGYQRIAPLSRAMLAQLSIVAAQSQADAERFKTLGLSNQQLEVTGSIKFDISLDETLKKQARQLKEQWHIGGGPLWIAASTHAGEDELILAAFSKARQQITHLRLVLVPRHPERFESVYQLCLASGFTLARRSSAEPVSAQTAIIMGDTMGEMLLMFGAADFSFIGGSLVNNGGHNMLESVAWGAPVLSGPSLFNFAEISQLLQNAGAMKVVTNSDELAAAVQVWATDTQARDTASRAGQGVVDENRGALQRLLNIIKARG